MLDARLRIEKARNNLPQILLLPEHWIGGGGSSTDPAVNPFLAAVAKVVQDFGIYCVPGTLEELSQGVCYTTAVLIGPDGKIIGGYRKRRPTHPQRYGSGKSVGIWDTPLVCAIQQSDLTDEGPHCHPHLL